MPRNRSPFIRFCLPVLLCSSLTWAQAPRQPGAKSEPGPAKDASPADPPADKPASSTTSAENDRLPVIPEVQDPMLAPVPPPPNLLSSWKQALQLVRNRSTEIATARAQVLEASGSARSALSSSLPTLTGTGSVNRHLLFGTGTRIAGNNVEFNTRVPDPAQVWVANLTLRQSLLNYRSWYDHGTAKRRVRVAALQAKDTERQVLAVLADAIVTVVTAERLSEVSRISLGSSLSTLDLTQRRARLGAATALDVLRAEQEVSLSRAQLVSSDETLRQAREALGMTLGYPTPWGVTHDVKLDSLARDAATICRPVAGLASRSDVQAAQANVEIATRQQKSSSYRILPTLDLTSDLQYTSAAFTPNNKPVQWTVGALLTIPFYDGGERYAARTQADAQAVIAQQELSQVKRKAQLEIVQAERQVGVAQANLEVSQRTRDIAKETARLAQIAFVNGSGTSFDLVDAAKQHREAELDLAIKEFEVVRARVTALLARANCNLPG